MMARQEGLEPPTSGLEGPCSIQLSYCRGARSWRILTSRPGTTKCGGLADDHVASCPSNTFDMLLDDDEARARCSLRARGFQFTSRSRDPGTPMIHSARLHPSSFR